MRRKSPRWGEQLQYPNPDQVRVVRRSGRIFVLLGADGHFAPSLIIVLEAVPGGTLEERLVFWNEGTVHDDWVITNELIAVRVVNNDLVSENESAYSHCCVVFDWADILSTDHLLLGASPMRGAGSSASPYRMYVRFFDHTKPGASVNHVRPLGRDVEVVTNDRRVYRLDPVQGTVSLTLAPRSPEDTESHRKSLERDIETWSGK